TWPIALVHGDLNCARAAVTARGVVLVDWERAYTGCALLDIVQLTASLIARGDAPLGIGLSRVYAAEVGRTVGADELRAAERLETLARRFPPPA
ncbi:MAG: hypothetical protein ACRDF0_08470, partial [Candidatus Limnocylindria bacterium]